MRAQLVADNGMIIPLAAETSVIGRTDHASGWVPAIDLSSLDVNRKSSRRHAEIRATAGAYTLKDLGAANKTFLNGQPLVPQTDYPLSEGDVITFGDVRLRITGIAAAAPGVRCPKCAEPITADMAICPSCGANLSGSSTMTFQVGEQRACFRCGRPARDGEHCPECAAAVAEADQEQLALAGLKRKK